MNQCNLNDSYRYGKAGGRCQNDSARWDLVVTCGCRCDPPQIRRETQEYSINCSSDEKGINFVPIITPRRGDAYHNSGLNTINSGVNIHPRRWIRCIQKKCQNLYPNEHNVTIPITTMERMMSHLHTFTYRTLKTFHSAVSADVWYSTIYIKHTEKQTSHFTQSPSTNFLTFDSNIR